MTLSDNGLCFACGPNNPVGLHLTFRQEGEEYLCDFTPAAHHQGFYGVVHGGIIATLLDEAMARYLWALGIPAVTAELKVSLHHPTRTGRPLTVVGRVVRDRGRLILCEAFVRSADGVVLASAEGKFIRLKEPPVVEERA